MDAYQNILSLRAVRHFTDRPLPEDSLTRILQAGRWTGSAKNTQPWHFIVLQEREQLDQLAECGHYASHLRGAVLAIVVVTSSGWSGVFDSGRAVQNMMLAAWAEGIASCIASLHDESCARTVLGVPAEMRIQAAISFGYPEPAAPNTIESLPRNRVLAMVGRRPLEEIVHWGQW